MKNLFKALADFQQECPIIHKDTQGYSYTYTDLPEIYRTINPLLKKHNLGFSQPIEGTSLKTIIFHTESGESIESTADIPEETMKGMNKYQSLGSGITYLRRYALSSALGLVTDKDMDASSIEDKLSRIDTIEELNSFYKKLKSDEQSKFRKLFEERKKYFDNTKTVESETKEEEVQKTKLSAKALEALLNAEKEPITTFIYNTDNNIPSSNGKVYVISPEQRKKLEEKLLTFK